MADIPCLYPAPLPQVALGLTDAFSASGALLQEMFAAAGDGAATGLALAQIGQPSVDAGSTDRAAGHGALEHGQAANAAPLFWVQEKRAIREMGRVFAHGLPPALRRPVLQVAANSAKDVLWAMEEGLKCPSFGAVIGEIHGNPRALDFTASRRLAVASERYGVPAFLLRSAGRPELSGARRRWRIESRPSLPHPHDGKAPGAPAWSLDLFRARDMRPGRWEVSYDRAAHRLDLVPAAGDGTLAQGASRYG